MDAWMLDFALLVVAVMMMGIALYKLLFSAEEEARREHDEARPKSSFERRNAEHVDRRRDWRGPPAGIERRQSIRR